MLDPRECRLDRELQNGIASRVRPLYDELAAALPGQSEVNADDLTYKQGFLKSLTWSVRWSQFTVFAICESQQDDHIQRLLGLDFTGTIMSDQAKMYLGFQTLQGCWAHL